MKIENETTKKERQTEEREGKLHFLLRRFSSTVDEDKVGTWVYMMDFVLVALLHPPRAVCLLFSSFLSVCFFIFISFSDSHYLRICYPRMGTIGLYS